MDEPQATAGRSADDRTEYNRGYRRPCFVFVVVAGRNRAQQVATRRLSSPKFTFIFAASSNFEDAVSDEGPLLIVSVPVSSSHRVDGLISAAM